MMFMKVMRWWRVWVEGKASPRVRAGNEKFDPLPLGNRAGNRESTAKDFHLFASILKKEMIISGYVFSLYYDIT